MEWFKRASGLKLFIGIWLLVFLVPVWRLNAARQWEKPQLYNFYASHDPGTEFETSDSDLYADWKPELGLQKEKQRQLASLYPDDVDAQLTTISEPYLNVDDPYGFETTPIPPDSGPYFQRFEALAKRYPHNLQILSQWLRDATQGELLIESDDLVKSYGIALPKTGRKAWLSVGSRQKALAAARQGGAADPGNEFWPWMEAIFCYSLQHPDDGLKALEKAGKCTRFDDGVPDTTRRRIAMMKRVQNSDFNDDYFEFFSALMPHLAKSRSVARRTMWQAKLALKQGDKAKALRIETILQEAAVPMAHAGSYLITRLVGEAICYITWQGSVVSAGVKIPKYDYADPVARENHRRLLTQMFADYASKNGEPEVGRRAIQLQATLNSRQLADSQQNTKFDGIAQNANVLADFHWLGAWLLKISLLGSVLWLVSLLAVWKLSPGSQRQRGALLGSAFCVGVTGAVFWAAMHMGAVHEDFFLFGTEQTLPPHADALLFFPVWLVSIWILPILCLTVASYVKRPQLRLTRAGVVKGLLYFGIVFGIWTWFEALSGNSLQETVWGQLWPTPLVVFWLSLLGATILHVRQAKGSARWIALLFWGALILASCEEIIYFAAKNGPFYFGLLDIPAFCLLAMAILLYTLDSNRKRGWLRPLVGEFVARIRIATATLALTGSLAYFMLALAALPVRHHAQALLNEQLKIGEVAFLEKRLR